MSNMSYWLHDGAENWSVKHRRFLRFCVRHSKDIGIWLHFILPIKRVTVSYIDSGRRLYMIVYLIQVQLESVFICKLW